MAPIFRKVLPNMQFFRTAGANANRRGVLGWTSAGFSHMINPNSSGGVTGRPETRCPRANVLGPLVLKLIAFVTGTSLTFCIIRYV